MVLNFKNVWSGWLLGEVDAQRAEFQQYRPYTPHSSQAHSHTHTHSCPWITFRLRISLHKYYMCACAYRIQIQFKILKWNILVLFGERGGETESGGKSIGSSALFRRIVSGWALRVARCHPLWWGWWWCSVWRQQFYVCLNGVRIRAAMRWHATTEKALHAFAVLCTQAHRS